MAQAPDEFALTLHIIYRETMDKLRVFRNRVAENKDLDAAAEFAKFILWSGIPKLLRAHSCTGFLKVDGSFLVSQAEELLRDVQDRWRRNDSRPHMEARQLQSLHEKLDLMAGHLARLTGVQSKPSDTFAQDKPEPVEGPEIPRGRGKPRKHEPSANVVPFPVAPHPGDLEESVCDSARNTGQ